MTKWRDHDPRESGLSVPDRHLLRIARDSLKMNDVMLRIVGGPSKAEAREIIRRLTGKTPKENPGSDEPANEHIRNALSILVNSGEGGLALQDVQAVIARLYKALKEVEGVNKSALPHRSNRRSVRRGNPPLAILGNPRVVDADMATWAKLEYHRPDDPDGDDVIRVHEFPDGFEIGWLNDGSVQLSHPKHALWMEDGEPKR